jgi:hypothetical protein
MATHIATVDHLLLRELNLIAIFDWVPAFNRCSCCECPACLAITLVNYRVHIRSVVYGIILNPRFLELHGSCLEALTVVIIDTSTCIFGDFVGKHIWELIETHLPCLIVQGVVFCDIFQCLFKDCFAHFILAEVRVGLTKLSEILDECTFTTVLDHAYCWEWGTVKGEDHNCGNDTYNSQGGKSSFHSKLLVFYFMIKPYRCIYIK